MASGQAEVELVPVVPAVADNIGDHVQINIDDNESECVGLGLTDNDGLSLTVTEDLFQCTICFNEFDESEHKAKLLPCHHTFCQHCLTSMTKETASLKCPICNDVSSITDVQTLKNNHYLAQFADVLQNFNSVFLDNIEIQGNPEFSLLENDKYCRKHGFTKKFFWCKTCEVTVCVHCMGLDHKSEKGHDVADLSETSGELLDQILSTLTVVNDKIAGIKRKKEASQQLDGSVAGRAVDAILNSTSAQTAAIMDIASDSALDPNSFTSKYHDSSSNFLGQDIYALNQTLKELKDLLDYFKTIETFIDEKFAEVENVQKGRIVLSILHKDAKFVADMQPPVSKLGMDICSINNILLFIVIF